jgi:hypothetical protein
MNVFNINRKSPPPYGDYNVLESLYDEFKEKEVWLMFDIEFEFH